MDLGLSDNKVTSFQLFQQRIIDEYDRMTDEYNFTVINGALPVQKQQRQIRSLVKKMSTGWEGLPHPTTTSRKSRKPLATIKIGEGQARS